MEESTKIVKSFMSDLIAEPLLSLNKATVINENTLNSILEKICDSLFKSDISMRLIKQLKANVMAVIKDYAAKSETDPKSRFINSIYEEMIKLFCPSIKAYEPVKEQENIFLFVGLEGVGKTTSCIKFASYYQKKNYKVCVIHARDTSGSELYDQLKQLNIPSYSCDRKVDSLVIAKNGLEKFIRKGFEIIIIDTCRKQSKQKSLFKEILQIGDAIKPNNVLLVIDSKEGKACEDEARTFKNKVDCGSVIITKLDGNCKGGGTLSAVVSTNSPITFIGTGKEMTNFEPYNPKSILRQIFDEIGMPVEDLKQRCCLDKDLNLDVKKEESTKSPSSKSNSIIFRSNSSKEEGIKPSLSPDSIKGEYCKDLKDSIVNMNMDEKGGIQTQLLNIVSELSILDSHQQDVKDRLREQKLTLENHTQTLDDLNNNVLDIKSRLDSVFGTGNDDIGVVIEKMGEKYFRKRFNSEKVKITRNFKFNYFVKIKKAEEESTQKENLEEGKVEIKQAEEESPQEENLEERKVEMKQSEEESSQEENLEKGKKEKKLAEIDILIEAESFIGVVECSVALSNIKIDQCLINTKLVANHFNIKEDDILKFIFVLRVDENAKRDLRAVCKFSHIEVVIVEDLE